VIAAWTISHTAGWTMSRFCHLLTPALILCLSLLSSVAVLAQNDEPSNEWNRFRGPNGSGIDASEKLPVDLQTDNAKWRVKLAGSGHSSPIIAGDQILVTSYSAANELVLQSLSIASGKQNWIWKTRLAVAPMHRLNSPAASTPAADSTNVYVLAFEPGHLRLFAINLNSGQQVWDRDFGNWTAQHGFASSPIVVDGKVVFVNSQEESQNGDPTANEMTAVKTADGTDAWHRKLSTDKASYSVPIVVSNGASAKTIISTTTAEGVYATSTDTGSPEWNLPEPFPDRPVGSAVVHGRMVYAACGSGGGGKLLTAINLDSPDHAPQFELHENVCYVPTPIFVNDWLFVFADNGVVSCIEPEHGKTVWRERVGDGFWGSPVSDGRNLFCLDKTGVAHVVAASNQFKRVGKFPLGEPTSATPAIANGQLFLRTETSLCCFGNAAEPAN
jgi:outer membrane protein assembly factor BamB